MNTLSINVHDQTEDTAGAVERRHYTVGALIAELQKYNDDTEIVIHNLATDSFGSISFQGVSAVKADS